MGIKKRERLITETPLNLVPVMDCVFILMFFLLQSAQFIHLYELSSETPVIASVPSDKELEHEPLNLTVKVMERGLEIRSGMQGKLISKISDIANKINQEELSSQLFSIRVKNPLEKFVIIAPEIDIKYEKIVKVMEAVNTLPEGKKEASINDNKGNPLLITKNFEYIVIEPNT
ncbi:MAG: biopolymer transporter ExbD [Oligoflexia bacterium]|nr:biopolymer transporter ExbD [Oligoflexia bacterium]